MINSVEQIDTSQAEQSELSIKKHLSLALGSLAAAGVAFLALATEGIDRALGADVVPDRFASAAFMGGTAIAGVLGYTLHKECVAEDS